MDRRGDTRVELVGECVHGAGGPVAVGTDVYADAATALRHLHRDVLEGDNGAVVGPPVLEELGSSPFLHVVVGGLG
ncbi:hypothetical protein GCM10017744_004810 [Streptomyces antimycoticus]